MNLTRGQLAMTLAGTMIATGAVAVLVAPGAGAISAGQSCKPEGAVYQTSSQTLLCARTPSDKKFRWRKITIEGPRGPAGPTGPAGPQGPPGPAGAGDVDAQTARFVEVPYAPSKYTHQLVGWQKTRFDGGGTLYWEALYEGFGNGVLTVNVPDGVRILKAFLDTTADCGSRPCYDVGSGYSTPLEAVGTTTYTWDGTPIDARSFQARGVSLLEDSPCSAVPDDSAACPYPESISGDFTYTLRFLVATGDDLPSDLDVSLELESVPTSTPSTTTKAPTLPPTPTVTPTPVPTSPPPSTPTH